MIYTGTVKANINVWVTPSRGEFEPHKVFGTDERVGVIAETKDKKWAFAYPLDGDGMAGWVETANIARDPILFVDCYWQNLGGQPQWQNLPEQPGFHGAIIKATEGSSYFGGALAWFHENWMELAAAAPTRLGRSWFRGCYHYLRFDVDGAAQADYYVKTVEKAGGWDKGDILPIVDIERGGEKSSNYDNDTKSVLKCGKAFVARVKQLTGQEVILYGRGAMRDLGITDRFGCVGLWNPSYTEVMSKAAVEKIGWTLADTWLWQYCGGEDVVVKETKGGIPLPHVVPKLAPGGKSAKVDISVLLLPTLNELRDKMLWK